VKVIHNGIDLTRFVQKDVKETKTRKLLGVSNVWDDRKGLNDFIQLRARLDSNIEIKLVGLSKKQVKSLPHGINGIERTESIDQLVQFYQDADIFINPTYSDNFPTTNLEALACGTPVVTYNTGGSPESIDERTGRVVEKGSIDGLKRAIDELLESETSSSPENCRKRAELLFDENDRWHEYLNLYQELINKN
jgi:glycosyltransferase involved in cell wall biosynthesis